MGSALAMGAVGAGILRKNDVVVRDSSKSVFARRTGFPTVSTVDALLDRCGLIFLCIKPQKMDEVLNDVAAALENRDSGKFCFVSIAAGVPLSRIEKKCGKKASLFRVMPNTPALLKAGMSALARGRRADKAKEKTVVSILKIVGEVVVVPEKHMDAVTALSGSGPAYGFYLAEGMIGAAVSLGISKELARVLVHQTLFGAGAMLKNRADSAEELRRQVTSPGGTTAAAIAELERKNFLNIVEGAVMKAAQRSKQLAKI
jgi:pyrroline-5-carboxylate reductase